MTLLILVGCFDTLRVDVGFFCQVGHILCILVNLIAEYKGSAANALFNYQALDADDEDDDEDYDGCVYVCVRVVVFCRFAKNTFGQRTTTCHL